MLFMAEPLRNPVLLESAKTQFVELPADLCLQAERKYGQHFKTLSELVIFVLNELLCDRAQQLDHSEQDLVETRLKELGYI